MSQGGFGGRVGGVDGEIHEKWSILAFLASHKVLGETRKRIIEVGVRLIRDQLPVLVQLRVLYGPVPFVPPRRNVVAANLAVAVEILAEQGRLVTCVVEAGGQRGSLSPELAERLESSCWGNVAPDQMVVRVLAGQDRGPGWAAERGGDECVVEGHSLICHVLREGRYLRGRRSVQVIGNYEDDVGTARCFYGPPL